MFCNVAYVYVFLLHSFSHVSQGQLVPRCVVILKQLKQASNFINLVQTLKEEQTADKPEVEGISPTMNINDETPVEVCILKKCKMT